jgi:hypothetical protein
MAVTPLGRVGTPTGIEGAVTPPAVSLEVALATPGEVELTFAAATIIATTTTGIASRPSRLIP